MKKKFYGLPYVIFISLLVLTLQSSPLRSEILINTFAFDKATDPQQLISFLERIYQRTLDKGIINFPSYSLLLIKETQAALKKQDYQKAEILSDYAQKFSPDLPPVYITKAKVQWSKNKFLIHLLIKGYITTFLKKIQNTEALSFMLFENLSIITLAFLLSLFIFSSISMLKYFKLAAHDFRHAVPQAIPDKVFWGIVLSIFLLPIFCNLAIFFVFIFWFVLLFTYHSIKERFVIIGFLILFALMPMIISATCFSLYIPQSELTELLDRTNYGYWNQRDIETLESYNRIYPDDQEILFSLGLVHKKEKNYRTAQRYFTKLITMYPRHYKAHVNIGNVYLATGRWQEAVEQYQEAISIAPTLSSAAHFNLARAYQQKFMFKEAEKELSKAKEINLLRINGYLKTYSENYNRLLIDETISKSRLWEKGYRSFIEKGELRNGLWDLLFSGIPLSYGTAVILCILFLCLILSRKDRFRIAITCKICGKPICKKCQKSITGEIMCTQCLGFMQKKGRINYKLREEKTSYIKRYQKIQKNIGTILSLFFPGAYHVWKGQTKKGTICLFLFFILILKVIFAIVLEGPWEFIVSLKVAKIILLVGFLSFFWFLLIINALKLQAKSIEESLLIK